MQKSGIIPSDVCHLPGQQGVGSSAHGVLVPVRQHCGSQKTTLSVMIILKSHSTGPMQQKSHEETEKKGLESREANPSPSS